MKIYQVIKKLCDESDISVNKLSQIIGLSSGGLARWDTNSPTVESLLKVAEYFNVSLDYFVGRTVQQTSISNGNGIVANGTVSNSGNNSNNNNFSQNNNQCNNLSEIEKALLEVSKDLTMLQKIDVVNYAREIKK